MLEGKLRSWKGSSGEIWIDLRNGVSVTSGFMLDFDLRSQEGGQAVI